MAVRTPLGASRGASVLAALVVAAVLASVAMIVQQESPVAYMQDQTAAAGDATKSESTCDPRFDYIYTEQPDGSLGKPQAIDYCSTGGATVASQGPAIMTSAKASSAACSLDAQGKLVPPPGRRSQVRIHVNMPNSAPDALKADRISECSENGGVVSSGTSNASDERLNRFMEAFSAGEIDKSELQKLIDDPASRLDESSSSAIADAFAAKQQDVLDEYNKNAADYNDTLAAIKDLGCTSTSSGYQCDRLKTQLSQIEQKAIDLGDEYNRLSETQAALAPEAQCTALGGGNCQNLPKKEDIDRCAQNNTLEGCSGYKTWNGTFNNQNNQCPGGNCTTGQPPPNNRNGNPNSNNPLSNLGKMLQGLGKALGGGGGSGNGSNQPEQCQPQYQCQDQSVQYNQCPQRNAPWQTVRQCPTGYSCQNNGCVATAPYGTCTSGQPRTAPPQPQPPASACTVGSWQDTSNGCQQSWQCVPTPTATSTPASGAPTAQLSCQPLKAVPNTTITFSYACAGGATAASATGFSIPSSTTLSGSATTSIAKPSGGTSVTYSLTCTNGSATPNTTASAQCVVQVGIPTIVMVATPEKIAKSETDDIKRKSTIGWVTSGMQSCVVSNTDFSNWTSQQAGNTSVSGGVASPVITQDTTFLLTCQTLAGTTATSSVKVLSI